MTNTYKAALEKSRLAVRAFKQVQIAYRTMKIGDADYLAGRAIYDASTLEFDKAFAAEEAAEEAAEKAAEKKPVEAYGVKGMKQTAWHKTFKSAAAMQKWTEANDATVHAYAAEPQYNH